jgi:sporulation protein YlmC with PRC-barrel domain
MKKTLLMAAIALAAATTLIGTANAQVAGSTARGATLTEVSEIAMGWSVKKSILGKTVYNDANDKVGTVVDLIITPDKYVSYLIIGAGGFVGLGRHDVAIPVTQVRDQAGKLVMAGATKDTIKALPAFSYATDDTRRAQFVAAADQDIVKAKDKLADLQKKASAATAEAKVKLDAQAVAVDKDLKAGEAKLGELRRASAKGWHAFEADVSAAMAKLRKTIEAATA